MKKWAAINYREFYDRPRIFFVQSDGRLFLFDSPFNEQKDEYEENYKVYLMRDLSEPELAGSWVDLTTKAVRVLGEVPVTQVEFDPSFRRQVNLELLAKFGF